MRRSKSLCRSIIYSISIIICFLGLSKVVYAAGASDTSASVMRLERTDGDVKLTNSSGKESQIIQKMRLNNGDDIKSASKSYAYLSLDDTKAVKLDANSEAVVKKNKKKLEVDLASGNLIFNVDKALSSDESFEIKTANMTMGIRGTCAQIQKKSESLTTVCLLEGTLTCTLTDNRTGKTQTAVLRPGDIADFCAGDGYPDGGQILIRRVTINDLRGFSLQYIKEHPDVAQKIFEQTGIDLRNLPQKQVSERLMLDEAGLPAVVNTGRTSPTANYYLGDH